MAVYTTSDGIVGWGEALPELLSTDVRIVNLAIPGATAGSFVRNGLPRALGSHGDVALVQFGHNFYDTASESAALDSIVRSFRRFGTRVILVTPMVGVDGRLGSPDLDSAIRHSASRLGCPLIPLDELSRTAWLQAGDTASGLFVDHIHLSAAGATRIASIVARELIAFEPELGP